MNRKPVVLSALLGILAICLIYAYFATPRLEKAPPRSESRRTRLALAAGQGKPQAKASQGRIDFAFLQAEQQPFPGAERDVFRFGQKRPEPVVTSTPEAAAPVAPPVVSAAPPVVPMVPIAVVQQALAQFTFLGFLEKNGEKTVFLSSEGSLFLAKRGERFGAEQEFTVEAIAGNLLQVRHDGRDGLIEIELLEQQKLNASASAPAHLPPEKLSSQPKARAFNPKRRMLRPAAPQGSEADFPGTSEENNPAVEEGGDAPVAGDDLQGEVNGSNQ